MKKNKKEKHPKWFVDFIFSMIPVYEEEIRKRQEEALRKIMADIPHIAGHVTKGEWTMTQAGMDAFKKRFSAVDKKVSRK